MIFEKINNFFDEFLERLKNTGIDITGMEIDHLGYKTESIEEQDRLTQEMLAQGLQVHENVVRGRRVRVFKLNEPIKYQDYLIGAVEVIAPQEGEIIKSGWEHAEIVPNDPLEEFVKKYPTLNWDTSVMNANEFPMVKLKLGEEMQVKFPKYPILESIKACQR